MTPIVTPEQMILAENLAVEAGTPERDLMRIAAGQIADWVGVTFPSFAEPRQHAVGLVGPGNNGGDTLVALGLLVEQGWSCSALLVGRTSTANLPISPSLIDRIEVVESVSEIQPAEIVLDGIFGNGARAELSESVNSIIAEINNSWALSNALRISIDAPTGVDSLTGETAETPFAADVTLCIGFPKIGLFLAPAADFTGHLEVLDIGIDVPEDFDGPRLIERSLIQPMIPVRSVFAHKRSVGSLLVVGGAPGYYGAPRLTAEAAYRVGAGLVGLAVPRQLIPTIAAQIPEAIYHPVNDTNPRQSANEILDLLSPEQDHPYSAVVLGPGLSQDKQAAELLTRLFGTQAQSNQPTFGFQGQQQDYPSDNFPTTIAGTVPLLIDADGLNWLAKQDNWPDLLSKCQAILTPHPGEFSRLTGLSTKEIIRNPFGAVSKAARDWDQVVVLKCGYPCVGLPEGSVWVCPRAPSELATAGTGDVLSGIIGGLLAQGLTPEDAARAGLFIGATAGGNAREDWGVLPVMARDVILELPAAIAQINGFPVED